MKVICMLLLVLASLGTFAQKKDTVSTTIIIFDNNGQEASVIKKKGPKNIVKADLLGAAFGKTEIYYERELADFFSVSAGAGITYRNFYYGLFDALKTNPDYDSPNWDGVDEDNNYDDYNTYSSHDIRKSKLGYIVSVVPKFYTASDGFEGFSIGLHLSYARFNFKANKILPDGSGYSKSDFQKEHINALRFSLDIGGQTVFKPLTLEYGFALGLSKNKTLRLDTGSIYNDGSGTYTYLNKTNSFSQISPLFNIYLVLGGAF